VFAYIAACASADNHPYFGVAERATPANGKKENLSLLRVLFADLDFRDSSEAEARACIAAFPLAPSAVVESGGGLYPFWLLKEPFDLRSEGAIARVEGVIRRVVATLRADANATDVTRLLRLPGTMNCKYDPPRAVLIAECHPERVYTLEQFEELDALLPDPKIMATLSKSPQVSYSIGVLNPQKVVNVLSKLWPDADSGKRHAFAKHIGGWLAHKFVEEDDAVMLIQRAAEAATDDDVDDRVRVVRDSFTAHAADKPVTGLPRAFEIVPELKDVVSILNEGLGIVPRPFVSIEEVGEPAFIPEKSLALPAEARLGLARRYADLYAEAYEAPWENFYFAFLTHLGARVAKHLRLENGLGTEPRLYAILLAPSGAGKSEAINKAAADFMWAELGRAPDRSKAEQGGISIVHGVGSGEALGEALEDDDKRSVLFQPDEFAHVANKMKIEGSSLTSILNTLFEKATWDNRVKGKKRYQVEGASLSFLTACVADVFPTLFDPRGGADQGIVNRFWIVAGPPGLEPKPSPQVGRLELDQIRQRLFQLLKPFQTMTMHQQVRVRMTPEATALYEAWYRNEYFPYRAQDAAMLRLGTYVLRFTMLLALAAHDGPVVLEAGLAAGPEAVGAALAMARWQRDVRRRYVPILAENQAAKVGLTILRVYQEAGEQGFTRRDAQRVTSATRLGVESWNRAFDALVQNGNLAPLESLAVSKSEKGGRPQTPRYRFVFS